MNANCMISWMISFDCSISTGIISTIYKLSYNGLPHSIQVNLGIMEYNLLFAIVLKCYRLNYTSHYSAAIAIGLAKPVLKYLRNIARSCCI